MNKEEKQHSNLLSMLECIRGELKSGSLGYNVTYKIQSFIDKHFTPNELKPLSQTKSDGIVEFANWLMDNYYELDGTWREKGKDIITQYSSTTLYKLFLSSKPPIEEDKGGENNG